MRVITLKLDALSCNLLHHWNDGLLYNPLVLFGDIYVATLMKRYNSSKKVVTLAKN